jgi:hypothetical protein
MTKVKRAELATRVYKLVIDKTESLEVGNVGTALAYLMGAILTDDFVEIRSGAKDPHMGALYKLLTENVDGDDPLNGGVYEFIVYVDDMTHVARRVIS